MDGSPAAPSVRTEWTEEADLPALLPIFNAARASHPGFPEGELSLASFRAVTEGESILVARRGDILAGFAAVWAPDCFLHHLYVAPNFQRQGLGRRLLAECLARFGPALTLKCLADNIPARHFYESTGWHARLRAMGPDGPYLLYERARA